MVLIRDLGRRILFNLGLLAAGPLLALVLLEAGARWIERSRAQTVPARARPTLRVLIPNPHRTGSYRLRPDLTLTTDVKGVQVDLSTNSHGMRGPEIALDKPAGVERVAFLGDSFTYGCWARDAAHSLVGVLGREAGERFEVLNFGVSGYGFDDMELQLSEEVLRFAPDYVVIVSYNGNDFRDTYLGVRKFLISDGAADLDPRVLDEKIPPRYRKWQRGVCEPAPDLNAARRWIKMTAAGRAFVSLLNCDNPWLSFRPNSAFTSEAFWSRRVWPDVALRAKDESLATLDRMAKVLQARGVHLGIVCLPYREQVYSRQWYGADWDVAYPQAYVRQWAVARGVAYLDLLPLMREHVVATNDRLYLAGDTHLDDRGYAVVGSLVRHWFMRQLVSDRPATVSDR
jgi:lysophospholipase L1-like esterase